jgi:hypothetical protein
MNMRETEIEQRILQAFDQILRSVGEFGFKTFEDGAEEAVRQSSEHLRVEGAATVEQDAPQSAPAPSSASKPVEAAPPQFRTPAISVSSGAGGSKTAQNGNGIASTIVRSAFGTVPLARLVMGLFGGDKQDEPLPLTRFALPAAVRVEAANSRASENGRFTPRELSYGQDGLARAVESGMLTDVQPKRTRGANLGVEPAFAEKPGSATRQTPLININVQAMDSRSFLDHSSEIAQAVREAMLNMHALNDVVSDL